jgi:hypothetical protein
VTNSSNIPPSGKAAICIKEMAARVGLSRQRFMQLVKAGVMPEPLRDADTGRPYYPEDLQAQCEEVKRRNVGINNKVVMFYARRTPTPTPTARPKVVRASTKPQTADRHADIVDGLHGLGLTTATAAQVADAVAELYPRGTTGTDTGSVIRAVFLHLRGKISSEKVVGKQ